MCSKTWRMCFNKTEQLFWILNDSFCTMSIVSQIKINEAIKHFVQKRKEHLRQSNFWNKRFKHWFAAGVRHCQNMKWSSFVTKLYKKKYIYNTHSHVSCICIWYTKCPSTRYTIYNFIFDKCENDLQMTILWGDKNSHWIPICKIWNGQWKTMSMTTVSIYSSICTWKCDMNVWNWPLKTSALIFTSLLLLLFT